MRADWKEERERERGFKTKRKWEGVPYMWAIGRENARAECGEFGARVCRRRGSEG